MANPGRLITFYSYKGGVGRSMALANVAWLLASNGQRVLAIDWDLEAPGLPRFLQPFVVNETLANSPGLLEYLVDCQTVRERESYRGRVVPSLDTISREIKVSDLRAYTIQINWPFPAGGRLDLLPAGKPGPRYAQNVTRIDWQSFYLQFDGHHLIEQMKSELSSSYDYVLIDSRTGLNETAGICTIQIPDSVVICFTLNRQSIEGSLQVAEAVANREQSGFGGPPVRIFPVPMRVERAERERLERARAFVRERFQPFLTHLNEAEIAPYWSAVEVPYSPFYALEEILCVFGDQAGDPASMLASMEGIARYLTGGPINTPALNQHERKLVLSSFNKLEPGERKDVSCFISHSSRDGVFAEKLYADLKSEGIKCWIAPHDLPIGAKIRDGIDRAIHDHDRVILILSRDSIASTWVEKEVETAFEREQVSGRDVLLPLRVDSTIMEAGTAWAADIRRQRNIGDFSGWRDTQSYRDALAKLLSSLRRR